MTREAQIPAVNAKVPALVRLPLIERQVAVGGSPLMFLHFTIMEIDGVGLYVYHRPGQIPDHNTVRRHIIGVVETYCHIEATSIEEALRIFHEEWEGAKTGTRAKALEINDKPWAVIEVYPECPHMYRGRAERLICGKSSDGGLNGEYGGCILEGNDPPSFCPIALARQKDHDAFKAPNLGTASEI